MGNKLHPPKMLKGICHKVISINGHLPVCECTETVTCSYCVQANLIMMEKKFIKDESITEDIIAYIKRNGIRKTARDLNIGDSKVRYWLKTKNIPEYVIKKYAGCANQ